MDSNTTSVDSVDDIINKLSEGDDSSEDNPPDEEVLKLDGEEESGESEKEDEEVLEEEKEEEKESDEEEEELKEVYNPFNKKKFLKDFPDAFKKYPALEKGYYASRAYREIFPTLDDAKEAAEKLETLEKHTSALSSGNSVELLKEIKSQSEENFNNVVNNYLGNLKEVDSNAYFHLISGIVSDGIIAAFKAGQKNENEDLMNAARLMKNFMFGDEDIKPSSPYNQKAPGKTEIEKEREQFNQEKRESVQTELTQKVDSLLNNTIKINIDPKDRMTPFIKKQAIREAKDLLDRAIKADNSFQSLVKKMWKKSEEGKFSQDSLGKIRSAYTSKAQALLPAILRKVRTEALSGTQVKGEQKERTKELKKAGNSTSITNSGEKQKFTGSTLDFLNAD